MIHILDAHSANQIAAGEVVERPASVVKELVENAIDSGAKHIDITVEGNGVPLIRVRDDGCGIGILDLPLAIIRHATSKIHQLEDLDHLRTLGFRGEALPSIASVSQMEISSRPADKIAGLSLTIRGGEAKEMKEVGCPVGTSVTVQNLFYNTPARLKFLKSAPTEFGLISDSIGRLALAHPEIAFSLTHPQQVILQTSGRGDFRETIGSILGHAIARRLIPISFQQDNWSIEGFISPPDLVRSSKQTQIFLINGRSIRSAFLSRALQEGYHTLIPVKLHPIVVLHLHLPPFDYDVNVHPTKMDVRFRHEQALSQWISKAVYQTLMKSKPLPSFETKSPFALHSKTEASSQKANCLNATKITPTSKAPLQIRELTLPFIPQDQVTINPQQITQDDPSSQTTLSHIWPLAQLFNTYILATDGETLLILDQHAAHERINYERLLREFEQAEQASQSLLIPLPMEFTLQEEQVLLEHLWVLNEMGFVLEQFGSRTYLLRGVPVQTGTSQPDVLLREFIEEVFLKNKAPNLTNLLEEWIYLLACKESIKAQDVLSMLEMEQLISRLLQTRNPYTCPHGRPTMVKMSRNELEKRFYRT